MDRDASVERDIWIGMFEQRKRELIREGLSEKDADDKASAEIRRQIRAT